MIAELRTLARAHAPDAIKELARLAVKAKSETARVAAIRELLDRGYGKAQQVVENEDDLSNKTADELRSEVLADFAALFPDLRIIPSKPPGSLAESKVRRLSFDRPSPVEARALSQLTPASLPPDRVWKPDNRTLSGLAPPPRHIVVYQSKDESIDFLFIAFSKFILWRCCMTSLLFSRRNLVLSATTTAAVFGLDGILAVVEAKQRQRTLDPKQGYLRFKVGDAEVTALYDGVWEKVHDPAYFANATVKETKQALAAAGFSTAYVTIPITTFVVKLNGKTVLCDAGGGDQVQAFNPDSVFVSGRMKANMITAGFDPKQVETILISHFHPDHIFGLLGKRDSAPVFPNAEIILSAAEYKFWTDPSLTGRLPPGRQPLVRRIQGVVAKWKNVLPVEGEDEVVPGIRFVNTPGHTPGHTSFHLSSGKEQLMISGDTAYVPALCATHPGWHGIFDQDGSLAETSRRKLLDRVVAEKMLVCGSHFPWPGLGRFAKDGGGYALEVQPA